MKDNEEGKMQEMQETAKGAQEGAKLAANIASGNIAGAAKNIVNLMKSKEFKKKLRKRIISILITALIPLIIGLCFFGIINGLKNTLIDLLSSTATSISSFLSGAWQYLTDDYWIKIDEKKEYTNDIKTGKPLDEPENYSIIDKYIKELGTQGVPLDSLRLLGDNADYSDKEKLLENENNRELVEKYIAEFIRADIITQQPHRRRGKELVNPNNQNYVDGGVYIYRTTKELQLKEEDFVDGSYSEENVPVEGDTYKKMDYMQPDDFEKKVKEVNEKGKSSSTFSGIKSDVEKLRYSFSIDKDTGELMIVEIKTKEIKRNRTEGLNEGFLGINNLSRWLQDKLNAEVEYELTIKKLDYKSLISKYTMPYEFLINLCNITQNPEFVYHVALLARETNIVLAIQDNTTMEVEANLTQHIERKLYSNTSPSFSGASISDLDPFQEEETITTTTQTPTLQIEYADTWSFYEEFEYTKNISGTIEEHDTGEVAIQPSGTWSYVSEHEEPTLDPTMANPDGSPGMIKIPEHYELEATTKRRDVTKLITTETTYNEPILSKSIEKSKQFLGLIRNETGKCEHDDCFTQSTWIREDPIALQCAKDAVFVKDGINVRYQIPNMTRTEDVYDNLRSGIDVIYAVLQSNSSGYTEKDKKLGDDELDQKYEKEQQYVAEKDYESAYVVRMQGLAEHLRYLMTFPENESYTLKDLMLEFFYEEDDDEYEDLVVDKGTIASAKEIYDFLIGKGFTPESACAILGNIHQESSFRTGATNGTHFGLCQWGGSRFENLKALADQKGTSWTDVRTQLEFLWSELCGSHSVVKDSIINSADMEYATDIFCRKFEICGNYGIEVPRRYKYAKYWYEIFVNKNDVTNIKDKQSALLKVLENLSIYGGITNEDGRCQQFVRNVFEKMGVTGSAASASIAESQWKVSSDMNHIPVGATVYGKGSSVDGHVGIYIGNGMVVHNIGKSNDCSYGGLKGIKCESISAWDSKYKFTSWGWQGGVDLRD